MIITIQMDKSEPQRKAFRITARMVGAARAPLSNVIGRER